MEENKHTNHHTHTKGTKNSCFNKKRHRTKMQESGQKKKINIPTEVWIVLTTIVLALIFFIAMPENVAVWSGVYLNKLSAVAIAFSFTSIGVVLYLLRGRVESATGKKLLPAMLKGICQVATMSGEILLGIFTLATISNPRYIPANYEDRISALEQAVSELREKEASVDDDVDIYKNIPAYWHDEIATSVEDAELILESAGEDAFCFAWASDPHIPDLEKGNTQYIGSLMNAMLEACKASYAVISGDIGTQSPANTEAELDTMYANIPEFLSPLWGSERLLMCVGNHDGCYGGEENYYAKQITPRKMYDIFFKEQAEDLRRDFSEDGTYFYLDDEDGKIRFIILNSQYGGKYLVDENGYSVNNRFATYCYGQEQLDWLANEALDMPEGYGAIIVTHVPLYYDMESEPDKELIRGIINSYCNRTTYSGSVEDGVDGWTNSSVNVDFRGAKGEIIAVFSGHVHQDLVVTDALACPSITITTAGGDARGASAVERVAETDVETAFDFVIIDRDKKVINLIRVGAGENRKVYY